MQSILNTYYKNNAKKLHHMVDKLLLQFGGIEDKDRDDFYSLANEVFCDVLDRYDRNQPFETFLYSCLDRKIKTEMTRRNRKKRTIKIKVKETDINGKTVIKEKILSDTSIYAPIGDESGMTIADTLVDKMNVEKEVLGEKREYGYSKKVLLYLNRLSAIQKEVLKLMVIGYSQNEIKTFLHISSKEYMDCVEAIRSPRNISILIK